MAATKAVTKKEIGRKTETKLTRRERLLFKELANPGISIAEAGRRAGYSETTKEGPFTIK